MTVKLKVRRKKIFLNEGHTKWCIVKLYKNKIDMQAAYEKRSPHGGGHYEISGCHVAYTKIDFKKGYNGKLSGETGTVFLNIRDCGAGIVCHELGHAILWAHRHNKKKDQFPIVIKDMDEEEEILYHLTYAIRQFYSWFWEVKNKF